ncbi:ABC transporter ATP-binding protein [Paramagnetospirillum kuznetsovii]|uniref:ABC transporter ATP-binding protein n=1 Tax=Paramagnetospirillum kuznetsovii TaxID=2053833 RepID=A0A364NYE4_9PROT|nr:ABC transporter ATP-binding protein [Paramagnetospirillum kuznetsovii]RAU22104.1 ABC transporter ATP-binding protein [Paramagnetospirillum kuznetsovii]
MISFANVSKTFKRHKVLDGITLSIETGERVALVGSNGAGKTTLIRCLLGEYLHEGEVTVGGLDPKANRKAVLARVGFVPQIPPPLKMPVGELVNFAAAVCDSDPERIIAMMRSLGLDWDMVRSRPFVKLSGGMKQKTLIAVALGRDADLLIMDEPAANLDPEARHIFFQQLHDRKDRAVMLITSHRLDEVASLVNRVVEMDQGKVALDDRVADDVEMTAKLDCTVRLTRPEPAFAKAMADWRFVSEDGGVSWNGALNGPDRLRFLGVLARYAGLVAGIEMK